MIDLSGSTPFAEGARRLCYQHPENTDLCVKISKPQTVEARRKHAPWYRRLRSLTAFDDNYDELKGYRQLPIFRALKDDNAQVWQHIPRCYGFAGTSLGPGLVLDYYHSNGKPAPTVQDHIAKHGMTAELQSAMQEFADFLTSSQLVTRAIIPHNIVWAADGKIKLIDGIGGRNLIPLAEFFPIPQLNVIAKRKTKRRLRDMWQRLYGDDYRKKDM